jgi:hypothetical protein
VYSILQEYDEKQRILLYTETSAFSQQYEPEQFNQRRLGRTTTELEK